MSTRCTLTARAPQTMAECGVKATVRILLSASCLLSAFSLFFPLLSLCPSVFYIKAPHTLSLYVQMCGCWCSFFLSFLPNPVQGNGLRLMGMFHLCSWEEPPALLVGGPKATGCFSPSSPPDHSFLCHGSASPIIWESGTSRKKGSLGLPYLSLPAPPSFGLAWLPALLPLGGTELRGRCFRPGKKKKKDEGWQG